MYLTESAFNMGSRFEKDMYSSMLEKISDTNVRQIFDKLLTDLGKKDEIILDLENKVDDLEQRVSAQERYSSKDCLILENLPIVKNQVPLSHQVCDFLAQFLQYKTSPSNFKACHLLGTWKNINYPPAVIVKFLCLGEKVKSTTENLGWLTFETRIITNKFFSRKGFHRQTVYSNSTLMIWVL